METHIEFTSSDGRMKNAEVSVYAVLAHAATYDEEKDVSLAL